MNQDRRPRKATAHASRGRLSRAAPNGAGPQPTPAFSLRLAPFRHSAPLARRADSVRGGGKRSRQRAIASASRFCSLHAQSISRTEIGRAAPRVIAACRRRRRQSAQVTRRPGVPSRPIRVTPRSASFLRRGSHTSSADVVAGFRAGQPCRAASHVTSSAAKGAESVTPGRPRCLCSRRRSATVRTVIARQQATTGAISPGRPPGPGEEPGGRGRVRG